MIGLSVSTHVILFLALFPILVVGPVAISVAAAPAEAEKKPARNRSLKSEERQYRQSRVKEVKELLKEARQGKRDDKEKYVLLRHLLMNYAILEREESDSEVREAKKEWDELLRKRPEFKTNPPPLEIKEQRELREQTKSRERDLEKKAVSYVPKDARAKVFWSGQDLVAVFQFRIEFYRLPENVECQREYGGTWQSLASGNWQGSTQMPRFVRNGKVISLKPHKTISFGEKVAAQGSCSRASKACEFIAVYSEKISPDYSYNDDEEWRVLRKLRADGKPYKFDNPTADYREFYGVFAVDGRLLGQVPFKAEPPGKILKALHVYPDGTALFGLGKAVTNEDDHDYSRFGGVEQVISWSTDHEVQQFRLQEALEKHPALKKSPWLK